MRTQGIVAIVSSSEVIVSSSVVIVSSSVVENSTIAALIYQRPDHARNDKNRKLVEVKRFSSLLVIIAVLFGFSCKKDPETVPGGTVRLLINVNHHGFPIANATVFRKNGTLDFPGTDTTLYDTRYVADASGNLIIDDIDNGNKALVLYAKGFDPAWDSVTVTPVSGYQYVSITTQIGESKDVTVTIPVSE